MKRLNRRGAIGLIAAALVLALGGAAVAAQLAPSSDFAPFTMRITRWTGTAVQGPTTPPVAGTSVQLLQYESIDSWKVTVINASWDPASAGTTSEVRDGVQATFFANAQRLFRRIVPPEEHTAPIRWVNPGLISAIELQGFVRSAQSREGTIAFVSRDATTAASGSNGLVNGTVVVFDVASQLPLSVMSYRDGLLRESYTFEVLSRP